MLQLDAQVMTIEGVTVFRDHADPLQFWALPGPVALARRVSDQRAALSLIKYKTAPSAAQRGGAYLSFEVCLALDADLQRRILDRLSSVTRSRPRLALVPFDDGTVQCVALNLQGAGGTHATPDPNAPAGSFKAVESILGATRPSLQGDNRAAFSLELSAAGATLLDKAFQELSTPIGVIYDLKYTGIRPAFQVKVTADFKQVFSHFSTSADGQRGFVRAGIDAGFEKLVRSGAIKIDVLDATGTADNEARIKDALDFFKAQVLNTWFTPVLVPGTLAVAAAQAASLDQVRALGAQLRPPQPPAPARADATAPAAEPEDAGASPTAGTGAGDAAAGVQPAAADAGAASPTEGTGSPAPGGPAPAGGGLGVGGARRPEQAAGAVADAPKTQQAEGLVAAFRLKAIRQEEQRTAVFEYRRAEAQQRTYAPQGFIGLLTADLDRSRHVVEVDLDAPFFQTLSIEAKTPYDFARIGLAEVHLALDYGPAQDPVNHKHADFVFAPDDKGPKRLEFARNLRGDRTFRTTTQFHFDPASDWEGRSHSHEQVGGETDDRTLNLNPMESLGFLEIRVEPHRIDPGIVEFIDVELEYTDPSPWTARKTIRVAPGSAAQSWKLRLTRPEQRAYSVTLVHHMKDQRVQRGPTLRTTATTVLVDDPFPGSLDLLFFPALDWSTLRAAMLDITYADPMNAYNRTQRVRLAPDTTEVSVRLSTVDPALKRYRHQLTLVRTDGTTERRPVVETEADIVGLTA